MTDSTKHLNQVESVTQTRRCLPHLGTLALARRRPEIHQGRWPR